MSLYSERLASGTAEAMLGPNPFVGFKARDIAREVVRVTKLAAQQPRLTAKTLTGFSRELVKIVRGDSLLAPHADWVAPLPRGCMNVVHRSQSTSATNFGRIRWRMHLANAHWRYPVTSRRPMCPRASCNARSTSLDASTFW